jgi:hypothetical protein
VNQSIKHFGVRFDNADVWYLAQTFFIWFNIQYQLQSFSIIWNYSWQASQIEIIFNEIFGNFCIIFVAIQGTEPADPL